MNRTLLTVLCLIYTLLLLLATAIVAGVPRFLPALGLLLILLTFTVRPFHPRYNVAVHAAVIFLTPLVLAPALGNNTSLPATAVNIAAVAMITPAFPLLDHSLRRNTLLTRLPVKEKEGIYVSGTFASLLALAGIIIFISLAVSNRVLLYTGAAFILYLAGVVAGIALTIPRKPLTAFTMTGRIIAGSTGDMIVDLTSRAYGRTHCQFESREPWLSVAPLAAILEKGKARLNISYTPPLAGNSRPQIHAIAKDPRGFVQICQMLEPVELRIIPRARYAEWLARKYLERSGAGVPAAVSKQLEAVSKRKGGTDYQESRDYTPGDRLKDIDWKHTLRLNQIIVKDYANDEEPATVIAVNLAVADAEEADKLSLKLVTAALTLARENIPTALTAYNDREVVLGTGVTEPDEALRQALALLKEIIPVPTVERHLEIADITEIKRNINQLKRASSEPAQRLLSILDFKYRSIEEFTRSHPAGIALSSTTKQVPAPATILLVSQLNHDAEVIRVISDKLAKIRFTTVPVELPAAAIPRE